MSCYKTVAGEQIFPEELVLLLGADYEYNVVFNK